MTVVGSVMGRAATLESNLSQLVQFQLSLGAPSPSQAPTVVLEPIDVDVEDANVKSENGGNKDGLETQNDLGVEMIDAMINSDSFNQVD